MLYSVGGIDTNTHTQKSRNIEATLKTSIFSNQTVDSKVARLRSLFFFLSYFLFNQTFSGGILHFFSPFSGLRVESIPVYFFCIFFFFFHLLQYHFVSLCLDSISIFFFFEQLSNFVFSDMIYVGIRSSACILSLLD